MTPDRHPQREVPLGWLEDRQSDRLAAIRLDEVEHFHKRLLSRVEISPRLLRQQMDVFSTWRKKIESLSAIFQANFLANKN